MNILINLGIRNRSWKEKYRDTFSLYPEFGALFDLANKFALKNNIFGLKWKCKTWDKINRDAMKVVRQVILEKLEPLGAEKVTYSRTCGCSCGCSPGFRVSGNGMLFNQNLRNKEGCGFVYIDLETTEAFEKKLNEVYQPMFDAELETMKTTQLELKLVG